MKEKDLETRLRLSRLQTESILLTRKYGEVDYDNEDGSWIHIPYFRIAPGWNKQVIEIMIDIPWGTPGYPQVAPQWFWTDHDLSTSSGKNIEHFFLYHSSDVDERNLGWGHFCIHLAGGWKPAPASNLMNGHSLLSYLELISLVFRDQKALAR